MQKIQHIKRSIQSIEIRSIEAAQSKISKQNHSNNRYIHAYLEPYVTMAYSEIFHI